MYVVLELEATVHAMWKLYMGKNTHSAYILVLKIKGT